MIDLHDYLSIGQSAVENRIVQQADTSEGYSSHLKNLLASPRLMHMAIEASIHAVDIHLPQEYISVGVFTEFTHTAPTGLGMHVSVRATIRELDEHEVVLELQAADDLGSIGHGVHRRSIVHRQGLEQRTIDRLHAVQERKHP